ncbi:EF-hand domain [Trinorchestia longiramus]|nr:EF-hand domain [Trinorchestia longiramus]
MRIILKRKAIEHIFLALGSCLIAGLLLCLVFHVPLRSKPSAKRLSSSWHAMDGNSVPGSVHDKVLKIAQGVLQKSEASSPNTLLDEKEVLTQAFKRCDTDGSGWLSRVETESCVQQQVTLHLTQAIRENFFIFTALDVNPRNGEVSWQEHVSNYLQRQGYDENFIKDHLESLQGLTREEKESIMRDKAAWSEAARGDPDVLSLDEFLAFHHPESSHAAIIAKVEELLAFLDSNSDGTLTRDEYCQNNQGNELAVCIQEKFIEVDSNADGKIDRKELVLYRDPRHPHHSRLEMDRLFRAADADADGRLTLPELLLHSSLFATSKMVDVAGSFHNEF